MAKTGPLGDVEKFYLENKHQEFSAEQLAKKLNRPKATVEKYIEKARSQTVKTQEETSNLFASRKGSTVMTQAASELGDEIMKQSRKNKPSAKCTTNIR